jgi:hypothetical protein
MNARSIISTTLAAAALITCAAATPAEASSHKGSVKVTYAYVHPAPHHYTYTRWVSATRIWVVASNRAVIYVRVGSPTGRWGVVYDDPSCLVAC